METKSALKMFAALSQDTRLEAFRHLVQAGATGLPAGTLSQLLGIPHNTLSFHLNHLSQAELVSSERQGRSIIYRANYPNIQGLIRFMVEDCCSGDYARLQPTPENTPENSSERLEISTQDGACTQPGCGD